jgi:hypothetical protein
LSVVKAMLLTTNPGFVPAGMLSKFSVVKAMLLTTNPGFVPAGMLSKFEE